VYFNLLNGFSTGQPVEFRNSLIIRAMIFERELF